MHSVKAAMPDVTKIHIESQRLILRPFAAQDLADLNEYASVPGVGEMAGWAAHRSMDESQKVLDMFIREKKMLALELKENGKVIGSLGLERCAHRPTWKFWKKGWEVGYSLSKDYWGRGLMPEAVKALMEYCFDSLGCDYLTCSHFAYNTQSRRVAEKCGFRFWKESTFDTRFGTREQTRCYVCYNPNK